MSFCIAKQQTKTKSKSYNILILNVGRRVELVNCFKNAAKRLYISSVVVGADCQDIAPALYFADKFCILPKISSFNYIDSIIDACNKNNISLVVPTIDTDLLTLAQNKEKIESSTSARVLISDVKVIETCRDKINSQRFLEKHYFNVPHMYTDDELETIINHNDRNEKFPLFIKPKDGSSSNNVYKVNNHLELDMYRRIVPNAIVQDFIQGEEFTVDCFLDFNSNIITVVPRLRIATRSGEVSKGKVVKDKEIIKDVKRLLSVLKPIGHITIQCMKTNKGIEYIEINPRFGGGAPMSIQSGADSCEYLYRLLMGEELNYTEDYQDNLLFLRFDMSICLNDKMDVVRSTIADCIDFENNLQGKKI